ncbi:MAG: DUF6390 family protein [Conexivisphaerales archaeon]
MLISAKKDGIILHAKHAYMPNSLGFCGPDEGGRILEHLQNNSVSEQLVADLIKFEAAYPFIRMIAESTGKDVFDYEIPEAYWIGNSLLERVKVEDFYRFSHTSLRGRDKNVARELFKPEAVRLFPHHTLYVLTTLTFPLVKGGPNIHNENRVVEQMDNCRISWGKVIEVDKEQLVVLRRPLVMNEGRFSVGKPVISKIRYDPNIHSFKHIKTGDNVSIHWNFACDKLDRSQAKNIEKYTMLDIIAVNKQKERLDKLQ